MTEEEIKALLKMGNESGTFDDDEREMIDSVFKFDERTAKEIMVPRRDVFTIDIEDSFESQIDEILQTRHSRIPVYEESIDNIIGVLHVKDVMIELRKNALEEGDIRRMLHKPFFPCRRQRMRTSCSAACRRRGITWRSWWTSTADSPVS